jgi:aspartate/methionine/tyrosine aminotransferase
MNSPVRIASLIDKIEPFYVMEVAKAASKLAREVAHTDRPMIFLNIGEPDFTAPPLVQEAAARAIRDGKTQYTQATGLDPLRERISHWYTQRFGVNIPASRIVVTAGASAALQLACLTLIESGEQILMPDPSYPCNSHFVTVAHGEPVRLPATAPSMRGRTAPRLAASWA